jgi:hypothetical protein
VIVPQLAAQWATMDGSFGVALATLQHALAPMVGCPVPWWVAGGWAIDLFLGRQTRHHHDVDIAILRRDQATVQRHLADWSLRWVESRSGGRFHPWRAEEGLAWPIHEIHGKHPNGATIELLLNEAAGDIWHFRRDPRIARPLSRVARTTPAGVPFLAPEVVLLYKAQEGRASDQADFANVRVALDVEQVAWLTQALRLAYGDHP